LCPPFRKGEVPLSQRGGIHKKPGRGKIRVVVLAGAGDGGGGDEELEDSNHHSPPRSSKNCTSGVGKRESRRGS